MLLEEFDVEKYERTLRTEGKEESIEIGRKEGRIETRNEAIDILVSALKELTISDEEIKKQLIKQYDLSDKEAEEKIKNCGKC